MKKLITILFLFVEFCNLSAEISVKSFRKLETDLDARVNFPVKDQNGDVCAIIKVVTTQAGFYFDGGQLGIVKTVPKHGEIWVYVPYGLKRMTISHDKLGILRDYTFNIPIEKATVYELELISGKVETIVTEEISSQWLLIHAEPEKAMIYLDNQFVKTGEYQAKLKPGKYDYRVEMPLYHTEAGKIEISDSKKELNVILKPAFGNLTITSNPEAGATVLIDGKEQAKTTPCQSENLASGEHTVQIVKEMYKPAYQKVMVTDGKISPVSFTLQPNFAELCITAPDADIYVNNQEKATGTWTGRVPAGIYSIEAKREKYRPAKQDIELSTGDVKSVNLQPMPIYGSLDIMTTPAGATITINGKDYGTTPNTVNKLLIGNYPVQLTKQGYATIIKTVTITDGKNSELVETLENGKKVAINSSPNVANLYIDGNFVGTTPFIGNLTFGSHILRIEKDGKKAVKTVDINQTDQNSTFILDLEPQNNKRNKKINGIRFTSSPTGAYLLRNGSIVGKTPFETADLPDGEYTFEIRCENFEASYKKAVVNKAQCQSYYINLNGNQSSFECIEDETEETVKKTVTITTIPEGAFLLVDGNFISKTPCTVGLNEGKHNIEFRRVGYNSVYKAINVDSKEKQYFNFEL